MKYEVYIDDVSREQWEQYAKLFADYSIYQTWPYQQVRADMDAQSVSRAIVTDQAGNPVTICQVRIKNVKMLRLRIGYVQWGPLLRHKDGSGSCPVEALQKLRESYVGSRVDVLRLVPNIPDDEAGKLVCQGLVRSGFECVNHYKPYRTFVLKVDDLHEQILSRLHKSFRRDLKKAESLGLQLHQGTDNEFCKVLNDLYLASIKRKGFKGLNPEELTRSHVLLSPSEKMRFFVASNDGEPVAILLASSLGDRSVVLLACGASYIVWYRGALAAHDAGMKIYDLGGIDPIKNPKVYQFKSRIGGSEVFYIGAFEAASGSVARCVWSLAERIYRFVRK